MRRLFTLIIVIVAFTGFSVAQTDVPTGFYIGQGHVKQPEIMPGFTFDVDSVIENVEVTFSYLDDYWLDMREVNVMGTVINMEMRRVQVSEIDGGWSLHRSGFEEFLIPEVWIGHPLFGNDGLTFTNVLGKLSLNSGTVIDGIMALDVTVGISLNLGSPLGIFPINIPVTFRSYPLVTIESIAADATGGGLYGKGAVVTIFAGTPPEGMQFKEWIVEPEVVELYNANAALTGFVMPENSITLTAVFEEEALVSVPQTSSNAIVIYPIIISDGNIHVKGLETDACYNVYSLIGVALKSGVTSGTINVSELNKGFYLLNVNGKIAKFYIN